MEKTCEFCKAISPIVYCKSDAAHLCLSCDARVHSANALSYRHQRTLVCESCRYQPASVRCFVHEMFMCECCDTSHCLSFQHEKRVVSCYVGCPSAKELAALWGLDLDGVESRGFVEGHSTDRGTKVVKDDNRRQQRSNSILQQILDLERLRLSDGIDNSCLVHVKERAFKVHTHIEHHGVQLEFQHMGSPREEDLSSPFSDIDHLSSTGNIPLQGDSFWQCKSPMHNNEIWLQNMQDLGVCDEVQCLDDVDIPDVDLTFRNVEELFGNEHEATSTIHDDEEITTCSFAHNIPSFGKLERGCASTIERSNDVGNEVESSDQVHQLETFNYHPRPIRLSYSTSPIFSMSRFTGKSSSQYKDDELLNGSYDSDNTRLDGKENVVMRYKEKKVLRHEKQGQYTSPKSKTNRKWSEGRRP